MRVFEAEYGGYRDPPRSPWPKRTATSFLPIVDDYKIA